VVSGGNFSPNTSESYPSPPPGASRPIPPPRSNRRNVPLPAVPTALRQFSRNFHLKCVPHGLFARLIVRFLVSYEWTPQQYCREWMKMTRRGVQVLMRECAEQNSLHLRVRGKNPVQDFMELVEGVTALLTESYNLHVRYTIDCPHCAINCPADPPTVFSMEDCVGAISKRRKLLLCKGTVPVPVYDLAPDVCLDNISDCEVVRREDLEIGEEPEAVGGYAEVYKGRWKGMDVAVKQFTKSFVQRSPEESTTTFTNFRREVAFMGMLRHKNIVSLKAVIVDERIGVVMEWCDYGSLYDGIHEADTPLSWPARVHLARDVARGMRYLHENSLLHRDLKSPNVLLATRNTPQRIQYADGLIAKIADFGLSTKTMFSGKVQRKQVDNPIWTAPEILSSKSYSDKVDVYSFGVILWELLTETQFFSDKSFFNQIEKAVIAGQRPTIPPLPPGEAPKSMSVLMQNCWNQEPSCRPSFVDVCLSLSNMEMQME